MDNQEERPQPESIDVLRFESNQLTKIQIAVNKIYPCDYDRDYVQFIIEKIERAKELEEHLRSYQVMFKIVMAYIKEDAENREEMMKTIINVAEKMKEKYE